MKKKSFFYKFTLNAFNILFMCDGAPNAACVFQNTSHIRVILIFYKQLAVFLSKMGDKTATLSKFIFHLLFVTH